MRLSSAFDLPGIDPASIEVTVDRGVLAVSAQRTEEYAEGEKPFIRERVMGSFSAVFVCPMLPMPTASRRASTRAC